MTAQKRDFDVDDPRQSDPIDAPAQSRFRAGEAALDRILRGSYEATDARIICSWCRQVQHAETLMAALSDDGQHSARCDLLRARIARSDMAQENDLLSDANVQLSVRIDRLMRAASLSEEECLPDAPAMARFLPHLRESFRAVVLIGNPGRIAYTLTDHILTIWIGAGVPEHRPDAAQATIVANHQTWIDPASQRIIPMPAKERIILKTDEIRSAIDYFRTEGFEQTNDSFLRRAWDLEHFLVEVETVIGIVETDRACMAVTQEGLDLCLATNTELVAQIATMRAAHDAESRAAKRSES